MKNDFIGSPAFLFYCFFFGLFASSIIFFTVALSAEENFQPFNFSFCTPFFMTLLFVCGIVFLLARATLSASRLMLIECLALPPLFFCLLQTRAERQGVKRRRGSVSEEYMNTAIGRCARGYGLERGGRGLSVRGNLEENVSLPRPPRLVIYRGRIGLQTSLPLPNSCSRPKTNRAGAPQLRQRLPNITICL